MLTHLHISNFTLVDVLDLELNSGLTALTGETGAGKSIMLDALALALGARADGDKVRAGSKRADVHASFDISKLKFARKWLEDQELSQSGQENECILRRLVAADGRSRSFINGHTVTLQQLRTFSGMLIDIHSQHEHQSLLKPFTQRRLLDEFGGLIPLAKQVREAFNAWQTVSDSLEKVKNSSDEMNARFQLLSYQVDELEKLNLEEGELEELEKEQKTLSCSEQIQQSCQGLLSLCEDDSGIIEQLSHGLQLFKQLPEKSPHLTDAEEMLKNALVQVQEAQTEITRHLDSDNNAPERLPEVESRLSDIYEIARKHRVAPEQLTTLHRDLATELASLQSGDEQLEQLQVQERELLEAYQNFAQELTQRRQFAASRLDKTVQDKLGELAMEHAKFCVNLVDQDLPTAAGAENIEFLISTNPGQTPKPLGKIASGGELSRISLAIQVVTAQTSTTPTIVFDEVDVGVGGTTGDVVGSLLRELGENGQIICVTHLAQVASKAHNHLQVNKDIDSDGATSNLKKLSKAEKVAEIARMMGGDVESKQSLAHAREMLKAS